MATETMISGDLRLRCIGVRPETAMAKTYSFVIEGGGAPSFHAGQFFNFVFEIDGQQLRRSYSISSPDTRSQSLSITVKRDPKGYVSNWLFDNMEVGRTISATGPLGQFHCADLPADAPLLLITAGRSAQ